VRHGESASQTLVRICIEWILGLVETSSADGTNVGFGGSNAVTILEEAPATPRTSMELTNGFQHVNGTAFANGTTGTVANNVDHDTVRRLFVLSAKSETSLNSYLSSFTEYLDMAADSRDLLNDLSYTLGQRRTHHPFRVAATADSVAGLKAKLSTAKACRVRDRVVVFVFTGQGVQ
jgi:acyl transferase domain-containing protein